MQNNEKTPIGKNIDDVFEPSVVNDTQEIGLIARLARKEQGLIQQDVAGLANVGMRFLSEFENGKPTVQLQKALDILSLLGLEVVIRKKQ